MKEDELFRAYGIDEQRWAVRAIAMNDRPVMYYVQDTYLGYCTDPMTFQLAVAEAARRNKEEPRGRRT